MNIFDLPACNLIGLASLLAILLSNDLNTEEIGILAAFFTSLGDNLALITASPSFALCEENNDKTKK